MKKMIRTEGGNRTDTQKYDNVIECPPFSGGVWMTQRLSNQTSGPYKNNP